MNTGTSWPALEDDRRRLRIGVVLWTLAACAVLVQGTVDQVVDHGRVTAEFLVRWRLYPIALWGVVAPLVLRAGGRWPFSASSWTMDLAVHGALFSGWMLLSNALLRLPELLVGADVEVGLEAMAAAVDHAPAGAVVWAGLVAIGRRTARRSVAPAAQPTTSAGSSRTEGGRPAEASRPAENEAGTVARSRRAPLPLQVGYRTYLVHRRDIRWVEADGDYLRVHTDGRTHRIRGPMKAFRRELDDPRFLRIHRSSLVNVDFVREVQPLFHGDHVAILRDGTKLRIPRSRPEVIRKLRGAEGD